MNTSLLIVASKLNVIALAIGFPKIIVPGNSLLMVTGVEVTGAMGIGTEVDAVCEGVVEGKLTGGEETTEGNEVAGETC